MLLISNLKIAVKAGVYNYKCKNISIQLLKEIGMVASGNNHGNNVCTYACAGRPE